MGGNFITEIDLIKKAQQKDHEAFKELSKKYLALIFQCCLKFSNSEFDAKDISQEVLIKVYQQLYRYNEKYAFSTWIYRITTNCSIDFIRKNKRGHLQYDSVCQSVLDNSLSLETQLIKNENHEELYRYINRLPIKQRTVLILYYFEGLQHKDISSILEVPLGTVHSRINSAKKVLRSMMHVEKEDFL